MKRFTLNEGQKGRKKKTKKEKKKQTNNNNNKKQKTKKTFKNKNRLLNEQESSLKSSIYEIISL